MYDRNSLKSGVHYGWAIVFAGTLTVFSALGLSRFALGMLLPSMSESLGLNYARMGMIGTSNFIGYTLSVILCGRMAKKIGPSRLIVFALILISVSLGLISRSESFGWIAFLYFLTGFGSGAANVPTMALVSSWFARKKRGLGAGFIVSGSGFGIIFTGALVPFVNNIYGAEGWRLNWLVIAGVAFGIAVLDLAVLRNSPSDMGLRPYGEDLRPEGIQSEIRIRGKSPDSGRIYGLGALYFIFGFAYVIYVTFLVTMMTKERGMAEASAGWFWSWLGLLSLLSGPLFGTLSDKIGRKAGLQIVFALQAGAYLIAGLSLPSGFIYLSIGLFGICAWSIPSIMAAAVGDYAGPEKAAHAFGFITFIFALGQVAGPAVAGWTAEATGTFKTAFLLASALSASAVVLAGFLKKPSEE